MTDLAPLPPTVDEDAVRGMLYRVTRALANANRPGRRADIEALVRESWELLGSIPEAFRG